MNLIRERPLLFRIRFENSGLNGWLLFFFFSKKTASVVALGRCERGKHSVSKSLLLAIRTQKSDGINFAPWRDPVRVQCAYPCVYANERGTLGYAKHTKSRYTGRLSRRGCNTGRVRGSYPDASSFEADR